MPGKVLYVRPAVWRFPAVCSAVALAGLSALLLGASASSNAAGPQITNPWTPMTPGTTFISYGTQAAQFSLDRTTVLKPTKVVDGVVCRVELDRGYLAGRLDEVTYDYFAEDAQGNVWYYGESSYTPVRGRLERNGDSWLAGVDGARPGIVMKARPQAGASYAQENFPGQAEDHAKVLGYLSSLTIPQGTYRHVLETEEYSPLEPGVVERKYYAPGIGFVESVTTKGPIETLDLVSIKR
jgi:hypothetical protein